ncbi:MAG: signal peptidase II [Lachnospiraceae bacterium]|nr:signal peptidase II [Lachnospiraceae bacterium]
MNSVWKRYGIFGVLSILLIAFDQWTKVLAFDKLRADGPIVILDGVFELLYSENRGAAFGILQGQKWFFLLVAGAVVVVILYFLYKMPANKKLLPLYFCTVLLASGAIGNVIDRLSRGFVVDFLYFKLIDFPIFNVADCYVVVSAGLLILLTGFYYKDEDFEFLSSKEK